jgi:glycosyltransferase involved in cell wall biosynthesis
LTKILIISFTFPPYDGIGGRRWAKFAKYLNRMGNDVCVIAAMKSSKLASSQWLKDIEEYKNKVLYVKPDYPEILMRRPSGIYEKLLYRWSLYRVKRVYRGVNYYDHSTSFGRKIIPIIRKKVNEGYKNIIVSIGPFHMAWELLQIKKEFPDIHLIVDYRDPWADNKTSFGFTAMDGEVLRVENDMETEVVSGYDRVWAVSTQMIDNLMTKVSLDASDKFMVLPNGFDIEDIKDLVGDRHMLPDEVSVGKYIFAFSGTLYNKTKELFEEFIIALNMLKEKRIDLYQKCIFQFCGEVPDWFDSLTSGHNNIRHLGNKKLSESLDLASRASVLMLFLTDDLNYSRSTKFYESLALRKPILVFSKEGDTMQFVEQNKLGYGLRKGYVNADLLRILELMENGRMEFNSLYELGEYEVSNLTRRLVFR